MQISYGMVCNAHVHQLTVSPKNESMERVATPCWTITRHMHSLVSCVFFVYNRELKICVRHENAFSILLGLHIIKSLTNLIP